MEKQLVNLIFLFFKNRFSVEYKIILFLSSFSIILWLCPCILQRGSLALSLASHGIRKVLLTQHPHAFLISNKNSQSLKIYCEYDLEQIFIAVEKFFKVPKNQKCYKKGQNVLYVRSYYQKFNFSSYHFMTVTISQAFFQMTPNFP